MKDYLSLKMFLQSKTQGYFSISDVTGNSSKIIVSCFDSKKSEEENVRNLINLYHCDVPRPGKGYPNLIYGDDFGVAIYRIDPYLLPKMREYCKKAAQDYNQLGYVEWNDKTQQAYFIDRNDTKTALLPWDNTVERLEEWVNYLHPGFKFEGIWNRGMSYMQQRTHEIKVSDNLEKLKIVYSLLKEVVKKG